MYMTRYDCQKFISLTHNSGKMTTYKSSLVFTDTSVFNERSNIVVGLPWNNITSLNAKVTAYYLGLIPLSDRAISL